MNMDKEHISVVIPALNEERAIGKVVSELAALQNTISQPLIDHIIVCDNGSTDNTALVAKSRGAQVVYQSQPGYGIACLTALKTLPSTDIVLFVDGDDSCVIEQALVLLNAVSGHNGFDMAIGSRAPENSEAGSLTTPQIAGNWLATRLIQWLWNYKITDLGPFRAIRYKALQKLKMQDKRFGWTVEMQIKAIQQNLDVIEIPISATKRIGNSKISGTLRGVIGAGIGIIGKIVSLRLKEMIECNNNHHYQAKPGP